MDTNPTIATLSQPLARGRGWLTFLGILSLLYGLLMALSIIGLLVAWIPIWLGILLIQAAGAIGQAETSSDPVALQRALAKLKTYFTIWGVLAIIMMVLTLLPLILMIATGGGMLGGEMFREFQEMFGEMQRRAV